MPAIDYAYDPTAALADNLITNEVHTVDTAVDRSVFPHHGPFYGDMFNFVVEGRQAGQAWVELMTNIDFQFSPIFIEAAAKTGKQVHSYIILITAHDEVRIQYRAIGQYTDAELLAQIQATTFDRSKVYEWSKIYGDAVSYHPRVRDPDVIDKDPYEIINIGLQRILEAIESPNSSTVITAADITQMQTQISNSVSREELDNAFTDHSETPAPAGADVPTEVISVEGTLGVCGTLVIAFVATDGRVQMTNVNFARNGNIIDQTIIGETFTDDELFTFAISVSGDRIVLNATPIADGRFTTKVIYLA